MEEKVGDIYNKSFKDKLTYFGKLSLGVLGVTSIFMGSTLGLAYINHKAIVGSKTFCPLAYIEASFKGQEELFYHQVKHLENDNSISDIRILEKGELIGLSDDLSPVSINGGITYVKELPNGTKETEAWISKDNGYSESMNVEHFENVGLKLVYVRKN